MRFFVRIIAAIHDRKRICKKDRVADRMVVGRKKGRGQTKCISDRGQIEYSIVAFATFNCPLPDSCHGQRRKEVLPSLHHFHHSPGSRINLSRSVTPVEVLECIGLSAINERIRKPRPLALLVNQMLKTKIPVARSLAIHNDTKKES